MALPFIVGPHQCSLTQGPDGRPQVEVVLRIRLPLAEFFDALLLTLAEQRPLFPQGGHEPDPVSIAPVILPRRFHLLIPPTKSCWRYSRKLHNSLTLRSEGALLLLQIPHLLTLGGRRGRQPWHRPMTGLPDRPQAVGSRHSSASHKGMFTIVLRTTARKNIYHRRVHLRTQRSALSSEPEKRLNAPLPHSSMGPHNCLHLSLQTFGSE